MIFLFHPGGPVQEEMLFSPAELENIEREMVYPYLPSQG
jgi:hypothetical protein